MAEAANAAKAKKEPAPKIPVTMKDGRILEFTERGKCITEETEAGLRFNFKSGDQLEVAVADLQPLHERFLLHGIKQKYQDEFASAGDAEDAYEWVSDLHTRLLRGEWRETAEGGGGVSGAGLLVRALMEVFGKSREDIKAYLADKSRKEQEILREHGPIKAKIDEIKARAPKSVDNAAKAQELLQGLGQAA